MLDSFSLLEKQLVLAWEISLLTTGNMRKLAALVLLLAVATAALPMSKPIAILIVSLIGTSIY